MELPVVIVQSKLYFQMQQLFKFLVPIFISLSCSAQTLVLEGNQTHYSLGLHFGILEDATNTLTLSDITNPTVKKSFIPSETNVPNLGFTQSTVWLRTRIDNVNAIHENWILEMAYPVIDSIEVFYTDFAGVEHHSVGGDTLPLAARQIPHREILTPITLPRGEAIDVYIKVKTEGAVELSFALWEERAFWLNDLDRQILFGIYYGIIIVMFFYNLFIYFSVRDVTYIYYVTFLLCLGMVQLYLNGHVIVYIWQDSSYWVSHSLSFFQNMAILFLVLFSRSFLATRTNFPLGDKLLVFLSVVSASLSILCLFLSISLGTRLSTGLSLMTAMVLFSFGLASLLRKYKPARLFMFAYIAFLSGATLMMLKIFGILPSNLITTYALTIGSILEMILLSFALADKINFLTQENAKIQREANRKLQKEVENRTHELKVKTEEALKSQEEALLATKAKSEFLANMSHEIRTPMNGVIGMAELLSDTPLTSRQLDYVNTINNSGQALVRVINDILDYSKIEAGKLEIDNIDFDLYMLIDECFSVFALKSLESDVELLSFIDKRVPQYINSDPTRLRQIFMNLLSNAFKFTSKGEVIIEIGLSNSHADDIQLEFSIADSGIGMSEEQQKKLFKKFSQADSSITRKYGGTGLGLAICQHLVGLMGGAIGVNSTLNQGSHFWFSIQAKPASSVSTANKDFESIAKTRLLVVDDHECFSSMIQKQLNNWGLECVVTNSAESAKTILQENCKLSKYFDLTLINYTLPDMTGVELINQITQEIRDKNTRFILMSAALRSKNKIDNHHQIEMVLEKPISSNQLRKAIIQCMNVREYEGVVDAKPQFDADFSSFNVMVVEDNKINQIIIQGMLKKLDIAPIMCDDGIQALEAFETAERPFDLVFMDCEMPRLGGLETALQIRNLETTKSNSRPLFIVGLSAHAMQHHREEALAAGMDEYITKPFNRHDICRVFETFSRTI